MRDRERVQRELGKGGLHQDIESVLAKSDDEGINSIMAEWDNDSKELLDGEAEETIACMAKGSTLQVPGPEAKGELSRIGPTCLGPSNASQKPSHAQQHELCVQCGAGALQDHHVAALEGSSSMSQPVATKGPNEVMSMPQIQPRNSARMCEGVGSLAFVPSVCGVVENSSDFKDHCLGMKRQRNDAHISIMNNRSVLHEVSIFESNALKVRDARRNKDTR
ncbi:hypothetical protein VNO78_09497 [Psophocarpus tetragonolobus]|uniref:Uncharacterized protein n=1 Tax=Psophocarpus tetragonolobus TaxID=3891 RepID=A0AAN9XU32_PSOTE